MVAAVTVRKNGFAEFAYVGAKAWHGLGNELKAGASIEEWVQMAGMDYRVQRSKIRYVSGTGPDAVHVMDDTHVLFRSDTKGALGVVSDSYKVVQPKEVLEFFRDLLPEGFTLNTAGTLFDGKQCWALAHIGEEAVVIGKDGIRGFLLLSTSFDGSRKTTAKFVCERVVCNNTLSIALGEKGDQVKVSHRSEFDPKKVKEKLGVAQGAFREFVLQARTLAKTKIDRAAAEKFMIELLEDTKTIFSEDPTKAKPFIGIRDRFRGQGMGANAVGAEDTLWGLVNAVTEYVDHGARAKTDSHRLSSAWFGRGDDLKTAALQKALVLV